MKEIWKDIEGYPNYKISNMGNVYSNNISRNLRLMVGTHGYYVVNPSANGRQKCLCVHVLVADHFLTSDGGYECVNHIDGNKLNNKAVNLEKVTYKENSQHAYDTGLQPDRNGIGWKRTEEDIRLICENLKTKRVMDVVRDTGFPESLVRVIKAKRVWVKVTSEYEFFDIKDAGANRYNAKLTQAQAEEIRETYAKYKTPSRKLGEIYGCSKPVILNIIHNRSYKRDENAIST